MTPILLKMYKTVPNCDTGYIEIRCNVHRDLLTVIYKIMLIRHDKIVARVSYDDESMEDTKVTDLTNRSRVSVQPLVSNIIFIIPEYQNKWFRGQFDAGRRAV